MEPELINVPFIADDTASTPDLDNNVWLRAERVIMDRYWSGQPAPFGRHCTARLAWSQKALHVRFDANQAEPLVVSETPNLETKTKGLWERDVCEIFIAPDPEEPRKYFEFEIAPNGEWLDVAIDTTHGERKTDWEYRSGMEPHAEIRDDKVVMAMSIPWTAFEKMPKAGDLWRGNLLRCVGKGPDRGYLAWSPTMTEVPNFHVPERFGEFVFVGGG